jgi:hypothetical protein
MWSTKLLQKPDQYKEAWIEERQSTVAELFSDERWASMKRTTSTTTGTSVRCKEVEELETHAQVTVFPALAPELALPLRPLPRARLRARERAGIVLALALELATLHRSHDPSLGPVRDSLWSCSRPRSLSPLALLTLLALPPPAPHTPPPTCFSPRSLSQSRVLSRRSSAQPFCVLTPIIIQQLGIGIDIHTRHPTSDTRTTSSRSVLRA